MRTPTVPRPLSRSTCQRAPGAGCRLQAWARRRRARRCRCQASGVGGSSDVYCRGPEDAEAVATRTPTLQALGACVKRRETRASGWASRAGGSSPPTRVGHCQWCVVTAALEWWSHRVTAVGCINGALHPRGGRGVVRRVGELPGCRVDVLAKKETNHGKNKQQHVPTRWSVWGNPLMTRAFLLHDTNATTGNIPRGLTVQ